MPSDQSIDSKIVDELAKAIYSGRLTVFAGSGLTVAWGRPSWSGAAENVLTELIDELKVFCEKLGDRDAQSCDNAQAEQLKYIESLRRQCRHLEDKCHAARISGSSSDIKSLELKLRADRKRISSLSMDISSGELNRNDEISMLVASIPAASDVLRRAELCQEIGKKIDQLEVLKKQVLDADRDHETCFGEAVAVCNHLDEITGTTVFLPRLHYLLQFVFGRRGNAGYDPHYFHLLFRDFSVRRFLTLNFDLEIERYLTGIYHDDATEREYCDDVDFWNRIERRLASRRGAPVGGTFNSIDNAILDPEAHARLSVAAVDRWYHDSFVGHLHGRIDSPDTLILADARYQAHYHLLGDSQLDALHAQSLAMTASPLLFVGTGLSEHEVLDPLRKLAAALETRIYSRALIALLPSACLGVIGNDSDDFEKELQVAIARDEMHQRLLNEKHGVKVLFYGQYSELGKALKLRGVDLREGALREQLSNLSSRVRKWNKEQSTVVEWVRKSPIVPIKKNVKPKQKDFCFVRHQLARCHSTGCLEADGSFNRDMPGSLQPSWYKRRLVEAAVERGVAEGLLKSQEPVYLVAGDPGAGSGRLYHTLHEMAVKGVGLSRFFFASTAFSMEYASVMESLICFLSNHLQASDEISSKDKKELKGRRLKRYDFVERLRHCLKLVSKLKGKPKFVIVLAGVERLMDSLGHFISADYRIALSALMRACHKSSSLRLAMVCDIHEARLRTLMKMNQLANRSPHSSGSETTDETVSRFVEDCRVQHFSGVQYLGELAKRKKRQPFHYNQSNQRWQLDAEFSTKKMFIEKDGISPKLTPSNAMRGAGIRRYDPISQFPLIDSGNIKCLMLKPLIVDSRQWFYHSIYRFLKDQSWEDEDRMIHLQGRWYKSESELLQQFFSHGEVISSSLVDMLYSQWLRLFSDGQGKILPSTLNEKYDSIEMYLESFKRLVGRVRHASSERCDGLVLDFLIDKTPIAIEAPPLRTRMVFRLLALCAMPVPHQSLIAYVMRYGGPQLGAGDGQAELVRKMLAEMVQLSLIYQLGEFPKGGENNPVRYAIGNGLRRHVLSRLSGHPVHSGESNFYQSNLYNIFPRDLPNFDGRVVGELLSQIEWFCKHSREIFMECSIGEPNESFDVQRLSNAAAHLRTTFGVLRNTCSMAIVSRAFDQMPAWREALGTTGVLDRFVDVCECILQLTQDMQSLREKLRGTKGVGDLVKTIRAPLHADELVWLYTELGCALMAKGNLYEAGRQLANVSRCGKVRPQSYSTILRNQLNQVRWMIERGKLDEARASLPALDVLESKICIRNSELYGEDYRSDERNALCGLEGWIAHLQASYDDAIEIYDRSLKQMAQRGRHRFCAFLCRNLAEIHLERQDLDAADSAIRQGYRFAERGQDDEVRNHLRIVHAMYYVRRGDELHLSHANQMLELVENYAEKLGSERILSSVRLVLAHQRVRQGNFAEAAEFASKSLAYASLGGLQLIKIRGILVLGESQLRRGATVPGRLLVSSARDMASRTGYFAIHQSCDRLLSLYPGDESLDDC